MSAVAVEWAGDITDVHKLPSLFADIAVAARWIRHVCTRDLTVGVQSHSMDFELGPIVEVSGPRADSTKTKYEFSRYYEYIATDGRFIRGRYYLSAVVIPYVPPSVVDESTPYPDWLSAPVTPS